MEGDRVVAVGSPDANVEVEWVASWRVGGGNGKPSFDGVASAVGDVPLWYALLGGDTLVSSRAPRGGSPVPEVIVASINQALTLALAGMSGSAVKGGVA